MFFQLPPDHVELGLDHAGRRIKGVQLCQPVQQGALQPLARQAGELPFDLRAQRGTQSREILQPQLLGKGLVDGDRRRRQDLLDLDVEDGRLALQGLVRVAVRQRQGKFQTVAGTAARKLLIELGRQRIVAQVDREVVGTQIRLRLAVDRAVIVDDDPVAGLRWPGLGGRFEALAALRQKLEPPFDHVIVDRYGEPLQVDGGIVRRCDLRQEFHRQGELQILPVIEARDLNLWLPSRAQSAVGQRLTAAFVDDAVQHLAHHRGTETLAQDRQRRLAGAKPRKTDLPRNVLELAFDLALDRIGGHDDLELASQPVGRGFRYLHRGFCPLLQHSGSSGPRGPPQRPTTAPATTSGAGEGTRTPTTCVTGT